MTALPDRYHTDQPTADAIPDIVTLLNDAAAFDNDNPATEEDLRRQWELTSMADVTLVRAHDTKQAVGIVGAVPMPSNQRLYLLFNVHPHHRETELPAFLLKSVSDYAAALPQQADDIQTLSLVHPINGANMWKREILPWYGFSVTRGMWKVQIDMDSAPEAPVFPDEISIRTFEPASDLPELLEVVSRTFESRVVAEQQQWLNSVTRDGDYDPALWYLACHQEKIIGFALCYPDPEAGIVALAGVLEEWRGRGLGVNLLRQSFAGFYQRGIKRVMMHIDSEHPRRHALRVYRKAGMDEIDALLIYEKSVQVHQPA